MINTLSYKNRCILKVHAFIHKEKIFIITMATDGLLNFWNFIIDHEEIIVNMIQIDDNEGFTLHQSGINSFDIKMLDEFKYLLATGGDDNLLSLMVFEIVLDQKDIAFIKIISSWKTDSAHFAQITGSL